MISSLPRFRGDLATSRQVMAESVFFIVKDPVRERFYRLPEEAHFIAEQLDGETPLGVVRRRAEEKFRTPLPPAELNAFVSTLNAAGLLDTGKIGDGKSRRRRIQGNPLYLRIRFFDPDRLFNYLAGKVRFFFTLPFLVISAMLILSAVYIAFANWEDAVQNLSRVFTYSAIPVILPVVFLVITAHEFAHGLTCKHFGGEVHELGFLLIYLQPALYCNVSDAWLFPEKSKRLWVGFAGPYFELFLWALATLAWRLTDAETVINPLAFIVMTSSGVKTLFNFNPLIKLDGYYLLSDWLEIPNLRKKSFACFGEAIKRLFGGKSPVMEQMPLRERRVCQAYGLLAGVGSFCLLGFAIVKIGGSLLQQSQPMAFALSAWLLGLKFRRRVRRFFGKSSNTSIDPDDPDSADAPDAPVTSAPLLPNEEQAATPDALADSGPFRAAVAPRPAAPGKRKGRMRGMKRWLWLAVLGGATSAALVCLHPELRIKGPFDVLPIQNADVRASVEGLVEEICVDEGQTVHQGD
ncbi:MAG TPA: M50 family metallopeptidase, partial [Verrucomicrobiae bacterium]|nr:M50 family metallopeptidase [Verrucomicrobiae bacterium]